MSGIKVRISAGELADRLTILRLKAERISDPHKRPRVVVELRRLEASYRRHLPGGAEISHVVEQLARTNQRLWDAENGVRACELERNFGRDFVRLARSIYRLNDLRSTLKSRINRLAGSSLLECKSYAVRSRGPGAEAVAGRPERRR